jgi:hypothetical protein
MWSAFYGCMSHYVLAEKQDNQYTCTIPFVYEQLTNMDPAQPVQFYYIPDFVRTYTITGIDEQEKPTGMYVSQNYPNPANDLTTIRIDLPYQSRIKLEIFSITGARVYYEEISDHQRIIEFKVAPFRFNPGIYFYKISSEFESVTRKMIVGQ